MKKIYNRTCNKCFKRKPISEFDIWQETIKGTYYRKKCKECTSPKRKINNPREAITILPWDEVNADVFDDLGYRDIWEKTYGPIPKGWHIHHIDRNHNNNDINNLCCVPPQVHYDIHFANNDVYACEKLAKQWNVIEKKTDAPKELSFDKVKQILVDLQHSTWRTSGRDKDRPQMWKDMASGIAHAIQHLEQINKYH